MIKFKEYATFSEKVVLNSKSMYSQSKGIWRNYLQKKKKKKLINIFEEKNKRKKSTWYLEVL